ncbi:hypothetical protein [Frankia gtarii]|uniref:hypothetical protein n=1 Tax=Frankia gtarii TaxID=2950102 RepID=UPI0021C17912|nr:hypothetical protein [Frankia gtarii]
MNGQDFVAVAVALLVPLATAFAGVLTVVVQDWRQRKSRADRRRMALEDATRQVAFVTDWWTARQLLPATPESLQEAAAVAQSWLNEASARVDAADELPAVQRGRLLLLYRFQKRLAKAIRIVFFAVLGVMAWASYSLVSTILEDGGDLGAQVVSLVALGVVALLLRFWAVSADSTSPDPVPPA